MRIPIAPEGWPFIAAFALLAIVAGAAIRPWAAILPVFFMLFMVFFFRDPERVTPMDEGAFISPADGKIIVVKNVYEGTHLKTDAIMISIFMSPFNVHVNRAPMDGVVREVVHNKGSFLAAYRDEASLANEHINMVLDGPQGRILVRQVAGFLACRAVCRVKPGDGLRRGERYGVIKFSSRLDVYLPVNAKVNVALNDVVKAGETILGFIK
jgi:phosphatidylserine decarboxylase